MKDISFLQLKHQTSLFYQQIQPEGSPQGYAKHEIKKWFREAIGGIGWPEGRLKHFV